MSDETPKTGETPETDEQSETSETSERVTVARQRRTSRSSIGLAYLSAQYDDDTADAPLDPDAPQAQTIVLPRIVAPHDPGLRKFHDIRNERYPMSAVRPLAVDFTPKTVHHRQYRWYNQGELPACTGFGSVTLLAAAHPFNAPPLTGRQYYNLNVNEDHEHDRFFDGGATTIAAMEVGRQLGLWSEYRWLYTLAEMQQNILHAPLGVGTDWYPSMWERGADGVVKMPGKYERPVGGHFYVLNGLRVARAGSGRDNLWRYPSTWGDGDYLIPDELMYRLQRDGGECTQPTELKLGPDYRLPAELSAIMILDLP